MLVEVATIPLVAFWMAEALAWLLLLVGLLVTVARQYPARAILAVIVGALLMQSLGSIQGIPLRTVALISMTIALAMFITPLFMRKTFASHRSAMEEYGPRGETVRKLARKLAWAFIVIVLCLAVIFGVIFKGAGW